MSRVTTDRRLAPIVVRGAVLGGVVLLATVPVYVYVEPPWRALVVRLAAALVLGTTLLHLRRALVDHLERAPASALDEARVRRGPGPGVPHRFQDLMDDVRAARRSRRYFEQVLWPRLAALSSAPLGPPPARRGRGFRLVSLRAVLDDLEKRP
jgi:hypothetical protein